MATGPDDFNLTISLDSLYCFQGDDIDDVFDEESEPYLWVFMVKIDNERLRVQGNRLVGDAVYFFSPGSHGNIGGSLLRGTRAIPSSVGQWTTSLTSIPISVAGHELTRIPGTILCAGVLLEENLTPNSAMEAARRSTIDLIVSTVRSTIDSIGLAGFAADTAAEALESNVDLATAARTVLDRRLKPIQDLFAVAAPAGAAMTVLQNLDVGGFLGTAIDRDKPMGTFVRTFGQGDLARTYESGPWAPNGNRLEINEKMWNMPEWAYTIHGRAWAHRRLVRAGVPTSERLQVTCTSKRRLIDGPRITGIGGVDGTTRWALSRAEAASAILDGRHSFFVVGDNGRQVDVRAVQGGFQFGRPWYFLQTQADNDDSNNLKTLPDCPGIPDTEHWY